MRSKFTHAKYSAGANELESYNQKYLHVNIVEGQLLTLKHREMYGCIVALWLLIPWC